MIVKSIKAIEKWLYSEQGKKFTFVMDVLHSIIVFGIFLPVGFLSLLWQNKLWGLLVFFVGTGLLSLSNAQKYYIKNYRY
mgnify:CR=1 FL=1